jgi:murein DD-endopeptidase MepM/ murein hydrolase activator NlpD
MDEWVTPSGWGFGRIIGQYNYTNYQHMVTPMSAYRFNWATGEYTDQEGNVVSFNEVYSNLLYSNAISVDSWAEAYMAVGFADEYIEAIGGTVQGGSWFTAVFPDGSGLGIARQYGESYSVVFSSPSQTGYAANRGRDYLVNPTGLGIRSDVGGDGHWGAGRGNRTHRGIDFSTIDGQNIVSPIDGRVRNFKGSSTGYPIIQIYPSSTNAGFDYIEILYAGALDGVKPWTFRNVSAGEIIGISLNLQGLGYSSNVGPHIHLQMWHDGTRINPTPFFFGP